MGYSWSARRPSVMLETASGNCWWFPGAEISPHVTANKETGRLQPQGNGFCVSL